ncbi:winged helix-turn-helix transcriptional regulator [Streptomyces sp. NPDC047072]|uniref:winged helix-turn-helix transcriptional regulator n=1 Tax=Streptomyces sp. NPDC047072 TaxID=3154809 RepID=UPI003403A36B
MPDRLGRWRRRGSVQHEPDEGQVPHRFGGRKRQNPESYLAPDDERFLRGIHNTRHLMSGEWTWDVLVALHGGPLQYTALLDAIRSIQTGSAWPGKKHNYLRDGTLNRTLRRLEQGELVRHDREPVFPYRAAYELTSAAQGLLVVVAPLAEWAELNADLLKRARERRRIEESGNS